MSNLESLSSTAFESLTDADAREVLGGLLPPGGRTTYKEQCLLNGQEVKDYETDPD